MNITTSELALLGQRVTALIDKSAEEYEHRGDAGDYHPNEQERLLMADFAHGIWFEIYQMLSEQAGQPQGPTTTGGSVYALKRIMKELPDLSVLDPKLVSMARSILEAHENRPRISPEEFQKLIQEGRAFADNGEDIERRFCEDEESGLLAPLHYPTEATPALQEVLSLMIMTTCPIAHAFRAAGYGIPTKTEAEQSFVLHWLIRLALEHGDDWRKVATERIKSIQQNAV